VTTEIIRWDASKEDAALIRKIVGRAIKESAQGAAAALKKHSQFAGQVYVATPPEGDASLDEVAAQIAKGRVLMSEAKVYAQGVKKGNSLVTAHAPFGSAVLAMKTMAKFGPIDSGIPEPEHDYGTYDDATPLSSMLQLKVLDRNDPTPFSDFWKLPVLSKRGPAWGSLTSSNFFPGYMFGPLLMKCAAPLSAMFHIPTLSKSAAPLSKLVGLATLSNEAAPLSEKIGWPTLLRDPAPLSNAIGLPLLLRE